MTSTITSSSDTGSAPLSLRRVLVADARATAAYRREPFRFRSRRHALGCALRLMVVSDAFLAQVCYRIKVSLQARGVPLLPRLAHRAAIILGQVSIGDPVVIGPGLYLMHGQVVIDGLTTIGPGARIAPFVTIGLGEGGLEGPQIGANVLVGTGARILGPVRIGNGAIIGANAVVVTDVPARSTAVGVPATTRSQAEPD